MFRVATIAAAAVSIAAAAPAHSENKPHSRTPIKTIDFYQAAKYRLTLSEVHEIALKVGIPLQAGYGTIGPTSAQRHQAQASAQPRATVIQTAMAQLPQPSTSPSPIDISQASWSDVTQADQPALPGLFDKFGQ